jgi:hypothetical protein
MAAGIGLSESSLVSLSVSQDTQPKSNRESAYATAKQSTSKAIHHWAGVLFG